MARPAADTAACCSAMPTSQTLSGKRSAKAARPTGCSMAAVIATTSSRSSPIRTISSPNTEVQDGPFGRAERRAGERVHHTDGVEVVLLVAQGRFVSAALLREAVHQHRPVEAFRAPQRRLDGPGVVPVDRAEVLQPQVLEEPLRGAKASLKPFLAPCRAS